MKQIFSADIADDMEMLDVNPEDDDAAAINTDVPHDDARLCFSKHKGFSFYFYNLLTLLLLNEACKLITVTQR